ncbi:Hypothetical predicted protein [Octopus vulgaris]|uniref:sulfiredoxin n=1 Tax=Octopus vulgaris TaxID=6645 RepID=A0AA36AHZ7_OCTVU|nr:Hypothetical predicted protein [Octopus vulgaris]
MYLERFYSIKLFSLGISHTLSKHLINPFSKSPIVFYRQMCTNSDTTIHDAHITDIHDVPIGIIQRPIPPVLDSEKLKSLMETIKNPNTRHLVPPIDVLWITGSEGGNYYYSFGGCHRFEAYTALQEKSIPCKLIKGTAEDLKVYMGSSAPDLR